MKRFRDAAQALASDLSLDLISIALLTGVLIWPWFQAGYLNNWGSIESTFIADARFLMEHWPHPAWQPLWYTGTRFDYIYPPALRYGTAIVGKLTGSEPVRAYHIYTALLYCFGPAGVYLLIRTGTGSRKAAWLGAAAKALTSPSFLLLRLYRQDSPYWMPSPLNVLTRYGEGPHISAVALLPFALAFAWRGLEAGGIGWIALAGVFSAAVVSHNFYGATALALFYPLIVWSLWIEKRELRLLPRAIAVPAIAWGLTASWLTPSYLKITAMNMKYVSLPGHAWSIWVAILAAAVFGVVTLRAGRGRPERSWPVFVAGSAICFLLLVAGQYFLDFRIWGEPHRLVPELDMALILLLVMLLARAATASRWVAAAVIVAAIWSCAGYLRHAWTLFPLAPDYRSRVEYRVSDWLWRNMPDARVHASGSVRFWLDAWHDVNQMAGGSDQGISNGLVPTAGWEIIHGPKASTAILWMQSLGVDAVYVSDARSEEVYKDFPDPRKFAGVLPVLYDDQQGNVVYHVPRRYAARARVVETRRMDQLHAPRAGDDEQGLSAYVDLIEHGPDTPVQTQREGADAMLVRANVNSGQSIVVQETYDPAWEAWTDGNRVRLRADPVGFMWLDVAPGEHQIALKFTRPVENRIGAIVTVVCVLLVVVLMVRGTSAA